MEGLQGFGFGTRKVVSDVEGLFQFGFGIRANAFFYVFNTLGKDVGGVNIYVTWPGGSDTIVNIDTATTYYRNYPADTPLTIDVAASANYLAHQVQLTIPAAGFRRIDIALQFKEAYARITKKRYL